LYVGYLLKLAPGVMVSKTIRIKISSKNVNLEKFLG
jgi:hypothetical protein